MTLLFVILHVIFCFVLIVVILIQGGRGQGLSAPSFGSGNVQTLFGTRAADFITKATSVSAICFLLTCIGLNYLEAQKSRSLLAGTRRTVPVDMEKIKKALEKAKAETPQKTAEPAAAKPAAPNEPSSTAAGTKPPLP